jgi:uncharacterized membrane protein YfcA
MGVPPAELAGLSALVFFAGVVDSLAGGGGLITLPAYYAAGLDPGLILGTNKLSSAIGTIASARRYAKTLSLALAPLAPALGAALGGSFAGARLAMRLDGATLRPLMLVAIPVVGAALWSNPDFGREDASAVFSARQRAWRAAGLAFPIGCYDGFFGPGTGTFLALGLAAVCRYGLLEATARAKLLNLATNAAALAAFLAGGRVHLKLGLAMGLVSVAGHSVGSRWGVRRGAGVIRPMVLAVCAGLFMKLAADAWIGR